jgi:predicted DNA-binding transcriptional regulator AlpA
MGFLETADELAQKLGVTPRTLARWREAGCGPRYVRIGRHKIGYPSDEVERWLAARTHESRAAEGARAATPTA